MRKYNSQDTGTIYTYLKLLYQKVTQPYYLHASGPILQHKIKYIQDATNTQKVKQTHVKVWETIQLPSNDAPCILINLKKVKEWVSNHNCSVSRTSQPNED